jgi:hypothetical protein
MSMANTSTATAEPPQGAQVWQLADWLPSTTGLDWLDALHATHVAAVAAFADAVERATAATDDQRDARAHHRHEIREALVAGQSEPPPIDDDLLAAKVGLAREEVVEVGEALDVIALDALFKLRERHRDLEPHFGSLSPALKDSLARGPGGDAARRAAEHRRALAEYEGPAGILDLTTNADRQEMAAHAR